MTSFDYRLNPLYLIKECSSCGALYTTDYCCSVGILGDKIICDLDKTPDLSQRPSQNCPKCGNPVYGHYCQGCALLREKFKENLFASCVENGILQDSFRPSNDNYNVANALQEPFVVNLDPGKNSSQSPPQIRNHCCYGCGDPSEGIFCHQCTCKLCGNGAHYGYNCLPKVPIIPDSEPFNNHTIKEFPPTMQSSDPKSDLVYNSLNVFSPSLQPPIYSYEFCRNYAYYGQDYSLQDLKQQYLDEMKRLINSEYHDEIKIDELKENFNNMSIEINKKEKLQQLERVANLSTYPLKRFNSFCYDDDDDDDEDYNFATTPNKPYYSLRMGDEHPHTVSTTESDEFIKSSVKNLVPIPSESEGESECDVPTREEFTTFSNILFDAEFDSNQHPHNAEYDLIESLHTHDSSLIILSKIDFLLDEFVGELTLLKSISPRIDETDCDFEEDIRLIEKLLYDNSSPRPLEEFVSANFDTETESFSPSPIPVEDSNSLMEEIDLSFTPDYPMPPGIENDDYDSEREILISEDLPSNDTLSLPKTESFHFNIPSFSRPPIKPPDGNTGILNVKMMGDISDQKVLMPKLMITLVSNQEKSPYLSSHQGLKTFQLSAKCLMMIHEKKTHILDVPLFHFYPP
nr:hypothetical protein [Tanacetum cinerariifolium]